MGKSFYKVWIETPGWNSVLRSPEVVSWLDSMADGVVACANSMVGKRDEDKPPFAQETDAGGKRASSVVYTNSYDGIKANSKSNVLIKALGGR